MEPRPPGRGPAAAATVSDTTAHIKLTATCAASASASAPRGAGNWSGATTGGGQPGGQPEQTTGAGTGGTRGFQGCRVHELTLDTNRNTGSGHMAPVSARHPPLSVLL